jgi:hypothetical protein
VRCPRQSPVSRASCPEPGWTAVQADCRRPGPRSAREYPSAGGPVRARPTCAARAPTAVPPRTPPRSDHAARCAPDPAATASTSAPDHPDPGYLDPDHLDQDRPDQDRPARDRPARDRPARDRPSRRRAAPDRADRKPARNRAGRHAAGGRRPYRAGALHRAGPELRRRTAGCEAALLDGPARWARPPRAAADRAGRSSPKAVADPADRSPPRLRSRPASRVPGGRRQAAGRPGLPGVRHHRGPGVGSRRPVRRRGRAPAVLICWAGSRRRGYRGRSRRAVAWPCADRRANRFPRSGSPRARSAPRDRVRTGGGLSHPGRCAGRRRRRRAPRHRAISRLFPSGGLAAVVLSDLRLGHLTPIDVHPAFRRMSGLVGRHRR